MVKQTESQVSGQRSKLDRRGGIWELIRSRAFQIKNRDHTRGGAWIQVRLSRSDQE